MSVQSKKPSKTQTSKSKKEPAMNKQENDTAPKKHKTGHASHVSHGKETQTMSTHSTHTPAHKHVATSINEEGETMSIQSASTSSPATHATTDSTTAPPASAAAPVVSIAATSTSAPAGTNAVKTAVTALGAGLLPLPPNVTIPSPPQGYEPTNGINFRGIVPWTAELAILPKVLQDLARFMAAYASVLGNTAPPLAQVIQALTAGGEWSTMRAASAAWDAYCRDQEGSAWRLISSVMDRLRPAFALAVQGDASLATMYPSLAELLGIRKASAQKGASVRRKNKKAKADGEPANHGASGKAQEKKAAKAALAAATAAAAAPAATVVTPAVTSPTASATPKPAAQ
jgi:hypothetical protein